MSTEPAGPRPGMETATIIPGYRLAEVRVTSALHQLGQIAHFVARERDTAVREREEALQEAGRLRARVEELEALPRPEVDEAVRRLDAITNGDPERAHGEADEILLACAPLEVREAHQRLVERSYWWATA